MKKVLAALVLAFATLSASIIAVPAVGAHTSVVNDSYRDQARRLYRTTLGREGEPEGPAVRRPQQRRALRLITIIIIIIRRRRR